MRFSRQGYWSGLPCPSPGDLPAPGNEAVSPVPPPLQVDSLLAEPSGKPKEGGGKIGQEWNGGVCVCVCVCVEGWRVGVCGHWLWEDSVREIATCKEYQS